MPTREAKTQHLLLTFIAILITLQSLVIGRDEAENELATPALSVVTTFRAESGLAPEPPSVREAAVPGPADEARGGPASEELELLEPPAFEEEPGEDQLVEDLMSVEGYVPADVPRYRVSRYVVQPGDSLWGLAKKFQISRAELVRANGLRGTTLTRGQVLRIPSPLSASVAETQEFKSAADLPTEVPLKVARGDTLSSIAKRFEVPLATLAADNGLAVDHKLEPGRILRVRLSQPPTHTVRKGDTFWQISRDYDIPLNLLLQLNDTSSRRLKVGQKVKLPISDASTLEKYYALRSELQSKRFKRPLNGRYTDRFGKRVHPITGRPNYHKGQDIAAPTGTSIRAARSGRVTFAGKMKGYGRLVIIRHSGGFSTWYGHCSRLIVKSGQRVKMGQLIAKVGQSGLATGPHLHFEIRKGGRPLDPLKYI